MTSGSVPVSNETPPVEAEGERERSHAALAAQSRKAADASRDARKKLLPSDVDRELPAMDCAENVQRRVEVVTAWACKGWVPGGVAGAVVRAAEVWHKLADLSHDRKHTQELEDECARLGRELEKLKARGD